MAVFASDDFSSHTPGDTVQTDADWTRPSWASNDWIVTAANRVRPNGTQAAVYHNTAPASADYSVSADLYVASVAAGSVGVCARMSTAANTFYWARGDRASNTTLNWQLFKFVGGTATQLGSSVTQSGATAGVSFNLKLNVSGSTIELYDEGGGTPTINASDSSITAAGYAGIRASRTDTDSTGYHLDNFSAEEAGGGVELDIAATAVVISGAVAVSGDLQIGTSFDVAASAVSLSGTLALSGDIQITEAAELDLVASPVALSGSLAASGDIQIGTSFDLDADPVALSGSLAIAGDLQITEEVTLDISAAAVAISGTLAASGDIEITPAITLDLDPGALALAGALALSGDIQVGTSFDLAASPVALSGALALAGDFQASEETAPPPPPPFTGVSGGGGMSNVPRRPHPATVRAEELEEAERDRIRREDEMVFDCIAALVAAEVI